MARPKNALPRNTLETALTKAEFHRLLESFLATSSQVIAEKEHGQTPWVWVKSLGGRFYLHADTTREGVDHYMRLIEELGDLLKWHVIKNERGRMNKVAFGDNKIVIPGYYMYKQLSEFE
jgi:hypothetical protein